MADGFEQKKGEPTGGKAVPQHEVDARLVREKTARLKALRLAQGGANGSATGTNGKRSAVKRRSGKSAEKARPLSEWLDAQEKEGRRN